MKSHGPKHRQTCSLIHAFPIFFSCVLVVKVYAGNPTFLWCYFIYILFSAQPLFEPQPVCVCVCLPLQPSKQRGGSLLSLLPVLTSQIHLHVQWSTIILLLLLYCIKNSRWRQQCLVQLIWFKRGFLPQIRKKKYFAYVSKDNKSYGDNTVGILRCDVDFSGSWGGREKRCQAALLANQSQETKRSREGERKREPEYRTKEKRHRREGKWWREWCTSTTVSTPSCAPLRAPISLPANSFAPNPLTIRPLFIYIQLWFLRFTELHEFCTLSNKNTICWIKWTFFSCYDTYGDGRSTEEEKNSFLQVWHIKLVSPKAALGRKKWNGVKRDWRRSPWQPSRTRGPQLWGCTGEFPFHQRCTSNVGLGLCALHAHAEKDISFSTFKGILIF